MGMKGEHAVNGNRHPAATGFTLIELMIAVAIVGILAGVAFPSYQDYVRRGHRASAQGYLMDLAQREQQYFLDNRGYASTASALGYSSAPSDVSPYYTVAITVAGGPPPTYSITATPTGSQASDTCGSLTLNSAGTKSSSAGSNCW